MFWCFVHILALCRWNRAVSFLFGLCWCSLGNSTWLHWMVTTQYHILSETFLYLVLACNASQAGNHIIPSKSKTVWFSWSENLLVCYFLDFSGRLEDVRDVINILRAKKAYWLLHYRDRFCCWFEISHISVNLESLTELW